MRYSVKLSTDACKRDSLNAPHYLQDLCKLIQARKDGMSGFSAFCTSSLAEAHDHLRESAKKRGILTRHLARPWALHIPSSAPLISPGEDLAAFLSPEALLEVGHALPRAAFPVQAEEQLQT